MTTVVEIYCSALSGTGRQALEVVQSLHQYKPVTAVFFLGLGNDHTQPENHASDWATFATDCDVNLFVCADALAKANHTLPDESEFQVSGLAQLCMLREQADSSFCLYS